MKENDRLPNEHSRGSSSDVPSRLLASDPRCLSPALVSARVNTGPVAPADPRLEISAAQLERYKRGAPPPDQLDELEGRAQKGVVCAIRQERPGVYTFVVGPDLLGQWGGAHG